MKPAMMECLDCRAIQPLSDFYACPACGGELKIRYDLDDPARRAHFIDHWQRQGTLAVQYSALLPLRRPHEAITLGEGNTPVIRARNLASRLGLRKLFLKLECCNPTGSFKDRQVAVGLSASLEFGRRRFAAVTSGNVGNALAAYAARAGAEANVWVASDTPDAKCQQIEVYGARLFRIRRAPDAKGDNAFETAFQELHAFCRQFGLTPSSTARSVNPFMVEGAKTIAYEIARDFGRVPPNVVAPVGGGGLLGGLETGFRELHAYKLIDMVPRLFGAQRAEYFIPLDRIGPAFPDEAGALPLDGMWAARAIEATGGGLSRVSMDEIHEAQGLLARDEGIFAEPRGAYVIAALQKLVQDGRLDRDEHTIAVISGAGLKDMTAAAEVIRRSGREPGADISGIWETDLSDSAAAPTSANE